MFLSLVQRSFKMKNEAIFFAWIAIFLFSIVGYNAQENLCSSNPCPEVAECLGNAEKYVCVCKSGGGEYSFMTGCGAGCSFAPCQNGGSCLEASDGSYACGCMEGYAGTNCETDLSKHPCASSPCLNGGTCLKTSQSNEFYCLCTSEFFGIFCEAEITDACSSGPCQFGSTCLLTNIGNYYCLCAPGYTGVTCTEIESCSPNPCLNGGACLGSNQCICPDGYTGTFCENFNPCDESPCLNGGTCFRSNEDLSSYFCSCADHFYGTDCEKIDYCSLTSCNNGGVCTNDELAGTFICTCTERFSGTNCDTVLVWPCDLEPCENGATCLNSNDDPDVHVCVCTPDYSGINCESRITQPCDSNPCKNGATCINSDTENYFCACTPDYTETNCEKRIDHCETNSCQNGATCQDVGSAQGLYICNCPLGYSGQFCQETLNPCQSAPCNNQGTCHNWVTHYTCSCPPAYDDGGNCDMLVDGCSSNPCSNAISCVNLGSGVYSCVCQTGFMGVKCQTNIDECASQPCENGGTCMDAVNGFECQCPEGFSGAICELAEGCGSISYTIKGCTHLEIRSPNYPDNYPEESLSCSWTLTTDQSGETIRMLLEDFETEGVYDTLEICDLTGGIKSNCISLHGKERSKDDGAEPMYIFASAGQTVSMAFNTDSTKSSKGFLIEAQASCMPYDPPCLSSPCKNGGSCENSPNGGFDCTCTNLYFGETCETEYENRCDPDPCVNGDCKNINVDNRNDYLCICEAGYSGANCDEATCPTEYCLNGGMCELENNTAVCKCGEYKGDRCQIEPCTDNAYCNNHGVCELDANGEKTCMCDLDWAGKTCDINEEFLCQSYECQNGGQCFFNEITSAPSCECPMYYSGDLCETDTNPCSQNLDPCLHNGQCLVKDDGSATCACIDGWTGTTCETWGGSGEQPGTTPSPGGNLIAQTFEYNLALDPWWIALICLVGVLLVVFICIIICTRNYKRSESKQDLTHKL